MYIAIADEIVASMEEAARYNASNGFALDLQICVAIKIREGWVPNITMNDEINGGLY